MSEKKTLYVIPHTHWDREWYMSFEQHRFQLVEFMDRLIKTMEENPEFTVYHLDGQYIPVEDYLEIRPQMRDRLLKLIREDRIQIGPWYVLQDEFLTSGEANVRNMLYGIKLCRDIGAEPLMCGYFPDAFGNISQAPQLLCGFDINNAVFGRGLGEVRYNNEIVPGQKASPSETRWRSPDGSEVMGIVFSHWYNNAWMLPSDPKELAAQMQEILDSACESAATPHLLGMNGCDHIPVQVDLPDVLNTARKLFPNVTFKQSTFKEYINALLPYKDSFPVIEGELRGQFTSGMCQLVSTASSHVPLKQQNQKGQNALEKEAEPLNVLSFLAGDEYREDQLLYAWKKLMQNHPHDSICSCSVDEVTREMKIRFDKSKQVADCISNESIDYLTKQIHTEHEHNLVVFHTNPFTTTEMLTAIIDLPEENPATSLSVYDENGTVLPANVRHLGRKFTYTLPKDVFRIASHVNRFEVTFPITMKGIGWKTLKVIPNATETNNTISVFDRGAENEYISFRITENGEIELTDKQTGAVYKHLNSYDNTGDIGDLYNFKPVENGEIYTTVQDTARVWVEESTPAYVTFGIENQLYFPNGVTGVKDNKQRTAEGEFVTISTKVTLGSGMHRLDFRTTIHNNAENFRLRAVFSPEIQTKTSLACAPFDIVERAIQPAETWESPVHSHRLQEFFALESEEKSLLIATRGLHEYEIDQSTNAMTLTILRSIGEIGDWGDFPTPDGFCKGTITVEYAVVPYQNEGKFAAYREGYSFSNPCVKGRSVAKQSGSLPTERCVVALEGESMAFSAFKKCEESDSTMLRVYNVSDKEETITLKTNLIKEIFTTNLAEKRLDAVALNKNTAQMSVGGKKICSLELKF